jgi:secretion system chaperone SscA
MANLIDYIRSGGTLRDLVNIKSREMEILHGYAFECYRRQEYESARQFYFALAIIDSKNFDFWLGAGMSFQKLNRHEEAVACFAQATTLRIIDPKPHFFAGISLMCLGELDNATAAISSSIKCCGQIEANSKLKSRAEAALASIVKEERS